MSFFQSSARLVTSPAADEFSPGAVDSVGQYAQGGAQWVLAFYGVLEHPASVAWSEHAFSPMSFALRGGFRKGFAFVFHDGAYAVVKYSLSSALSPFLFPHRALSLEKCGKKS